MTTTPGYDGCEWPLDPACFDEEWEALDPPTKARAAALASETLHRLSGYRVGGCPVTVRPCTKGCIDAFIPFYGPGYGLRPGIDTVGNWVNGCGCQHGCSCTQMCEVVLPEPVGRVEEVRLDGTVVDPTTYRVDRNRLVWTGDGDCPWPTCQAMNKDNSKTGTFSVTYLNSYEPDSLAAYACAVLAMEFAQACLGNACRLPTTVSTVARQGLVFQVPTGAFPGGLTGIREVDAWLALWNPDSIRQAPAVWSPDQRAPRVVNP
jgi:hypothetical protein